LENKVYVTIIKAFSCVLLKQIRNIADGAFNWKIATMQKGFPFEGEAPATAGDEVDYIFTLILKANLDTPLQNYC